MGEAAETKEFYRYEDVQYEDGPHICERVFYLVRETPSGYWISPWRHYNEVEEGEFFSMYNRKRWVSKTSRKRFAYPTRKDAMISFKARKCRQVEILTYQLSRAKLALDMANEDEL